MKNMKIATLLMAMVSMHAFAVGITSTTTNDTTTTTNQTTTSIHADRQIVGNIPVPNLTPRFNPMDFTPTLVAKGCPAGMEWAIEPGGVGFCRIPIYVAPPVVVEPVEVAAPATSASTVAVVESAPPDTTSELVAPIPLEPVAVVAPTTEAVAPVATVEPEPTAPVASTTTSPTTTESATTTTTATAPAATVTTASSAPSIGTACNGQDWMTQRTWSDGRVEWIFTPGWMNHSSATPFIDPSGVQRYDIVNSCG